MKCQFGFVFSLPIIIFLSSCGKPTETKEEFIQKGIIMSDTLLKSLDTKLKNAELTVDSAIKSGAFVPPPPTTTATAHTPSAANTHSSGK